jgi:hypothetical protein
MIVESSRGGGNESPVLGVLTGRTFRCFYASRARMMWPDTCQALCDPPHSIDCPNTPTILHLKINALNGSTGILQMYRLRLGPRSHCLWGPDKLLLLAGCQSQARWTDESMKAYYHVASSKWNSWCYQRNELLFDCGEQKYS